MVQILAAKGYDKGYGKIDIDVALYNDSPSDLVVAVDFVSTDATPVGMGRVWVCVPPKSGSVGCLLVRAGGMALKDPFRAIVYRCISSPNCAAQSCATASNVPDSSIYGEVAWGESEPSIAFNGIAPAGCISCTEDWQCEGPPLNGYEYDRCTQQRRPASRCNPIITKKPSTLTISSRNYSPFKIGETVAFYGILEETGYVYNPDINGAPVRVVIRVGGTTVVDTTTTTYSSTSPGENYQYKWTVPSSVSGASIYGKDVIVAVSFAGNDSYNSATATSSTYYIEGKPAAVCTISLNKPASTLEIGQQMTFSGQLSCDGIGMSGKTIEIWDTLGISDKIATATTTTTNGMFSAPWTVKDINYYPNSGKISVYAYYPEAGLKSQEYAVTLSSIPPPDIRYSCNLGVCQQTVNGQYATLAECQNACKKIEPTPDKYVCVNGTCQKDNMSGTMTLEQCQSTCKVTPPPPTTKYNCINNTCTADASGIYSVEECQNVCKPPAGCPSGYYKAEDGRCEKYIKTPFGNLKQDDVLNIGIAVTGTAAGYLILKEVLKKQ